MEKVLYYLDLKNNYYEKMYAMTLKQSEKAARGDWADLELFVENRERILNLLRSYDFKIATSFEKEQHRGAELNQYAEAVKILLENRKIWADKIIALDLLLMSKMEEFKNETIRELKKTVETQHQVHAFSGQVPKKIIEA